MEVGLFKDQLMISVAYFRNRTGNQLISYQLPVVTGFINFRTAKKFPGGGTKTPVGNTGASRNSLTGIGNGMATCFDHFHQRTYISNLKSSTMIDLAMESLFSMMKLFLYAT